MIGLRTLVLNSNYTPISLFPSLHTIPAEDAVTRVCNGTCHVVFEYDRLIRTPSHQMRWPSVVARTDLDTITEGVRLRVESLYYRDHGVCAYCGRSLILTETTCDHVVPRSQGGRFNWTNIVSACVDCNTLKRDSAPVGRWRPRWKPWKPTYYQLLEARRRYPIVLAHDSWRYFLGEWKSDVIVRGASV